eukprot:s1370_g20.t1
MKGPRILLDFETWCHSANEVPLPPDSGDENDAPDNTAAPSQAGSWTGLKSVVTRRLGKKTSASAAATKASKQLEKNPPAETQPDDGTPAAASEVSEKLEKNLPAETQQHQPDYATPADATKVSKQLEKDPSAETQQHQPDDGTPADASEVSEQLEKNPPAETQQHQPDEATPADASEVSKQLEKDPSAETQQHQPDEATPADATKVSKQLEKDPSAETQQHQPDDGTPADASEAPESEKKNEGLKDLVEDPVPESEKNNMVEDPTGASATKVPESEKNNMVEDPTGASATKVPEKLKEHQPGDGTPAAASEVPEKLKEHQPGDGTPAAASEVSKQLGRNPPAEIQQQQPDDGTPASATKVPEKLEENTPAEIQQHQPDHGTAADASQVTEMKVPKQEDKPRSSDEGPSAAGVSGQNSPQLHTPPKQRHLPDSFQADASEHRDPPLPPPLGSPREDDSDTVENANEVKIKREPTQDGRQIAEQIDKYAESIRKPGTYLEVIDAELFSQQSGKMLVVGVDEHNSPIEVKRSSAFWYTLVAGQEDGMSFPDVDRSDPNTWCIISCNARYDSSAPQRNHWIPAVFREQVTPEVYDSLTRAKCKAFNEKLSDIKKMINGLTEQKDELMKLEPAPGPEDEQVLQVESEIHFWRDEMKMNRDFLFLCNKCAAQGIALIEVPADGNCLAWSLGTLFCGVPFPEEYTSKKAFNAMKRVRSMIASAWQIRKDEAAWQVLFNAFCADQNFPETPKKKKKKSQQPVQSPDNKGKADKSAKKANQSQDGDLATPPRPDDPRKKPGVKRIEGAKPVPLTVRENPPSADFAYPGAKRLRVMEPEAPDLEEAFHQVMQVPPPQDPTAVGVEDVDETMLADDLTKARKRKHHERACKSRTKSEAELKAKKLDRILAGYGVTYQSFLSCHRKEAYVKKAATCESGWWKNLKAVIVAGKVLTCPACCKLISATGLTLDAIQDAMNAESTDYLPKLQKTAEKEPDTKEGDDGDGGDGDDADDVDVRTKILKYLDTLKPTIEVVDPNGPPILYRCTICVNAHQPDGKVNKLSRLNYKQCLYLMNQHLTSPGHIGKLDEKKIEDQNMQQEPIECKGVIVDLKGNYQSAAPSVLHSYHEELRLWLSFALMETFPKLQDGNIRHNIYSLDVATDRLTIFHRRCEKKFVPTSQSIPCCRECWSITGSRGLRKTLVRFCLKFYAAHLLQKRFFFPEDQLTAWLESLQGSMFMNNNARTWAGLQKLSNRELQVWVRKAWTSMNDHHKTPPIASFLNSVVEPCLQVHVGSVKSNLVALSSQFLDALCKNQQSEPRQLLRIWDDLGF